MVFTDMTLIDNGIGAVASSGTVSDYQTSTMNNLKFYGETEARDCEVKGHCAEPGNTNSQGCFAKTAFMPPTFSGDAKPALIDLIVEFPQFMIMDEQGLGGTAYLNNVQFIGFDSNVTYCGMPNRIVTLNKHNPDYIAPIYLTNTVLEVIIVAFNLTLTLECVSRGVGLLLRSTLGMGRP